VKEALGRAGGRAFADELEIAAAAAMVAQIESVGPEEMPEHMRRSVEANLPAANTEPIAGRIDSDRASEVDPAAPGSRLFTSLGWLAAAAAIVVAAIIYATAPGPASSPPPAEQIAALEAKPGTVTWSFVPWESDPGDPGFDSSGVTGRVVWNGEEQEGWMVFEGLAANDPRREQYQLWIVVPEDEQGNPIDGGVFNVPDSDGPVYIPIDAKLAVENAAAFGVTVEKPGGVVVSDQDRRVVVAKPSAG